MLVEVEGKHDEVGMNDYPRATTARGTRSARHKAGELKSLEADEAREWG